MKYTRPFMLTDQEEVRRIIRENPWATFVSMTDRGLIGSHYPVLLEEDEPGISIVSHFGKPDDELHRLGTSEIMVIVQGPHGYISPSWYENGQFIPTWNHVTAHLYGVPEILSAEENFAVLTRLVDHFEQHVAHPKSLADDPAVAHQTARGTTGLRIRVTRFEARLKLSQNKDDAVRNRIEDELDGSGMYANHALAGEMRRATSDPGEQS